MSVEQTVKEVIANTLSLGVDEVSMAETLAQSLDVDSTEMVDLRVALEKKFGIKLLPSEVSKNNRPQEIVGLIEKKQKG